MTRGESRACFLICLVLANQCAQAHWPLFVVWIAIALFYLTREWL